jgi:hypothetical protein
MIFAFLLLKKRGLLTGQKLPVLPCLHGFHNSRLLCGLNILRRTALAT